MALTKAQRDRAAAYARSRNANTRISGGNGASGTGSRGTSGFDVTTSAGRSTTSPGLGRINNSLSNVYWGVEAPLGSRNRDDYQGFLAGVKAGGNVNLGAPTGSSSGGSGGGRGGGGGGGGGLTQAMLDQMLAALGTSGPQLDLPDFQGANLPEFNPAIYDQANQQLATAVAADQAAINTNAAQTNQALQSNYTNAYANAPITQGPQAQQVGGALQATAGGGGQQAQIAGESNQAAQSDQASFQNLLSILAAADKTAQGSRMNQAELTRGSALEGVGTQNRALGGQIGMARTQAQQQWTQADAERRYQNSLMQQQIAQQEAQANWQQRNEMISSRLTPLLELLGQGGKLNVGGVQALLSQWRGA